MITCCKDNVLPEMVRKMTLKKCLIYNVSNCSWVLHFVEQYVDTRLGEEFH